MRSTADALVTSRFITTAEPPASSIKWAVLVAAPSSTSKEMTVAPAAARDPAIALPMAPPLPVTRAIAPLSLMAGARGNNKVRPAGEAPWCHDVHQTGFGRRPLRQALRLVT